MTYLKKIASSPLFIHLFALGALLAAPALTFGAISDEQASFTPLTTLPGVADASRAVDLPAFLNSLYRTCVGAAAVLAVLQIVRGGVTYMLGDSVTEKREARHHIALAVFGLVLVLAPALVFGIIDRRILDLSVDVSVLAPPPVPDVTGQEPCLTGNCDGTDGNSTSGTDTPDGPGAVGEGGDPAEGCDPGYEPVSSSSGETCEPIVVGEADDDTGSGTVPLRVCVSGTQDGTHRYVYVGVKRVTPLDSEGTPQPSQACADVDVYTEATSQSACQSHVSSSRTTLVACQQYTAGAAVDPGSVQGPLCAWSQQYALNSSNIDCD